jgi:Arc/MetJ-type ribon-helix-helix transcriptional regulator
MGSEQIAVRLPEQLLAELDDIIRRGVYDSRAAAVRAGLEAIMHLEAQRQIDRTIVDGYTRLPPTEADTSAALASLRAAILDEPW